jgi:hypothetical protein
MITRKLLVAACLLSARTATAGPYMTGIGMTNLNLFPDGLLPDFSGPLWLGGGYGVGLGESSRGAVLRGGLALIKFDGVASLSEPAGMGGIEVLVHLDENPYFTIGAIGQRGFGPILAGAHAGLAVRETEASGDSDYALVVGPELSYPLRWRAHPRFAPSAVWFVRVEVAISGRDSFHDKALAGVALALW